MLTHQNIDIPIEIDGGVTYENMEKLIKDGAEIFVAGSSIFNDKNPAEMIIKMKKLAKKYNQQ